MRVTTLAIVSFAATCCFSANVKWDCFGLADMGGFSPGSYLLGSDQQGAFYPDISLIVANDGTSVRLSGDIQLDGARGVWLLLAVDEVLNASTFQSTTSPFAYRTGSGSGANPVNLPKGSSFYLAVQAERLIAEMPSDWTGDWSDPRIYSGEYVYGWTEIYISSLGDLSLLHSALDLDGGPMIVGGGSAIPEPSGGHLLLLGAAALGLRRRKAGGIRVQSPSGTP